MLFQPKCLSRVNRMSSENKVANCAVTMIAARFLLTYLFEKLISLKRLEISAWNFENTIFKHKSTHWQWFRVIMTGKHTKKHWWIYCFSQREKMFYKITVKVITWSLYNFPRICPGVGWLFTQNFRKFHWILF